MGLSKYKSEFAKEMREVWGDSVRIYRLMTNFGAGGRESYGLASGPHPCNVLATTNYETSAGAGQLKQDNVFTSDKIRLSPDVDIESGDVLQVTREDGTIFWASTKGAPQVRSVFQEVYVNQTVAPRLSGGAWS